MDKKEVEMDWSIKGIVQIIHGRYEIWINSLLLEEEKEETYCYLYHEIAVGNI